MFSYFSHQIIAIIIIISCNRSLVLFGFIKIIPYAYLVYFTVYHYIQPLSSLQVKILLLDSLKSLHVQILNVHRDCSIKVVLPTQNEGLAKFVVLVLHLS